MVIWSWPEASELAGIGRTELQNPTSDGFVGHADATPSQQILDVPEAQRETAIKPNRASNDFGRQPVVAVQDRFRRQMARPTTLVQKAD